ncbi:glutathione S-transferase family protein [Phenylobacterium sp.]|uniref:glutathione S-transferase family protein n=1 Tax=Phenylobacterium sp. TaxID=1871053 RepID=UPI002600B45A|nr:glutathione S-transferase family protein [Phenylobacterium sp.]
MITLFTGPTGNGYRASILLEELGLAYVARAIDLQAGAARPAAFLAASPLGKIPAIVDDDTADGAPIALAESLAIALYLVEKTGRLSPATPAKRARAWEWAAIVASGFGAAFPGIFFARQLDEASHGKVIARHFEELDRGFAAMDSNLAARPFLAGDSFSFADALAAPLLPTARAFGVDLSRFPNVERWGQVVHARPAVQRGMAVKG